MTAVLSLRDVWKGYPDYSVRPRSLRGAMAGRVPLLRSGPKRWALRGVSFELAPGSSLGVVGHNGAGKSTLLRLASGLGRPTRGSISVHPDTASVLSLGVSFDGELTGRENAYTSALVAGWSSTGARRLVNEVLDFAQLEEFADAPVRTYSDGMRLRLAFGVVAASRPRLLVLDEVLAVGDIAFQRRCNERIAEMRADGTSLLLVSHAPDEVRETCDEAAWLHRGAVRAQGETEEVLDAYDRAMLERSLQQTPVGAGRDDQALELGVNRFGSQEIAVAGVELLGTSSDGSLAAGAPLRVRVRLTGGPVEDPTVTVSLRRASDLQLLVDLSTEADGVTIGRSVTEAVMELAFDRLELTGGEYVLDVGVFDRGWEYAYDFHSAAYELTVRGRVTGAGVLAPTHTWERTE